MNLKSVLCKVVVGKSVDFAIGSSWHCESLSLSSFNRTGVGEAVPEFDYYYIPDPVNLVLFYKHLCN